MGLGVEVGLGPGHIGPTFMPSGILMHPAGWPQ